MCLICQLVGLPFPDLMYTSRGSSTALKRVVLATWMSSRWASGNVPLLTVGLLQSVLNGEITRCWGSYGSNSSLISEHISCFCLINNIPLKKSLILSLKFSVSHSFFLKRKKGKLEESILGWKKKDSTLCHVRQQQEGSYLQAKNRALARNRICGHLDLRLFSLQSCEKQICVVKIEK